MTDNRIFVSYSRKDEAVVKPLVHFLRLGGTGVFRDVDHIRPGFKWRAVLIEAVESCELLVLFWCAHSSRSAEVEKEYKQAIACGKQLAPVLLDDTPLTEQLAEYQAIDMRSLVGNHVRHVYEDDHLDPGVFGLSQAPRIREEVCVPARTVIETAGNHLLTALATRFGASPSLGADAEPGAAPDPAT